MQHDLVVRGGTIIDGSGKPGYTADLGVKDGRIVEIGRITSRGHRDIDASGLAVMPGFVDGHTHMDAQLNWDPLGTSSSWQGVTTAVMGNCGFTLAPVQRGQEGLVTRNLERAEDISAIAMAAGIHWRWERFADYLDVLDSLPKGINYAANIGHSALRTWSMGERAFSESARENDLERMDEELGCALAAGAIGFSTSRSYHHQTSDDRPVASRLADWNEVRQLVRRTGANGGIFELAQERSADPGERADFFRRLRDLAVESGALVTFGVLPAGPREAWHAQLDVLDETAALGGRMVGQSHSRGVSILISFETSLPFDRLPEWRELRSHSPEEQKLLLRDPDLQAKLVHSAHHGDYGHAVGAEAGKPDWDSLRIYQNPLPPNPTVAKVAQEFGMDPVAYMIKLALETDFKQFFISPAGRTDEDDLLYVLRHPRTVMTFSDAGAHLGQIVDACVQTHLLAYWARDRAAFTIEEAVRMVTSVPAGYWGFRDRGLLRENMAADINLIDLPALSPGMPAVAHDLPGGVRRLIMKPDGIKATIVAGELLFESGSHTGTLPGKLLRQKSR
jgi:N-acyl-D-aspartate/D-glutamate deacylase